MKICHYNNHQAGVVVSDKVINFGDNLIKAGLARQGYTMVEIIDALANNPAAMQIARDAAQSSSGGLALSSVKLLAPIQNPGSLWAAAANYYAHRAEMVDRIGELPRARQGNAPVQLRVGVGGSDLHRRGVVVESLRRLSETNQRVSPVYVGVAVVRIHLECVLILLDGSPKIPLLRQAHA